MSHESGHTDLQAFGGFEKGVWLVVRKPLAYEGGDPLEPETYHQLVHGVGGPDHGPVVGIAFVLGSMLEWQDGLLWKPDADGTDWQKLQYMLGPPGDDPEPKGKDGRPYLQKNLGGHTGQEVRVVGWFELGYGAYMHPMKAVLGIDHVRGNLGKLTQTTVTVNLPTGPPLAGPATPPSEAGLVWPIGGVITTTCAGHLARGSCCALDIDGGDGGEPVVAAHGGVVTFAGGNPAVGYGLYVEVVDDSLQIGTRYAHFQSPHLVSVGQVVARGQVIGLMGTTGRSTGPHLHFEVHSPVTSGTALACGTAQDPMLYLSGEAPPDQQYAELPTGIQNPATTYTTFSAEGLDGTVVDLVGDAWKTNPEAETKVWRKVSSISEHIHRRTQVLGLSPLLIVLDGEDLGPAWSSLDTYRAVQGQHYNSPRTFWAPRVRAAAGEAGIRTAWKNCAAEPTIGLIYGRCELTVDLAGADPTHLLNMYTFAGGGVSVAGLRGADPTVTETVTSGILFLDDVEKVLTQGLEAAVQSMDKAQLAFWNYGNRWNDLVMKWAVSTPVADMQVLTEDGAVVTVDQEPHIMPPMVVGDFFGRLLLERVDWKTGDRLPNFLFFETVRWQGDEEKPPGFRDWGDIDAGTPPANSEFGQFYLEEVARDGTFSLERHDFPPRPTASPTRSLAFFLNDVGEELAVFGSAGLHGVHGWHMHLEKGIFGEGFMDSQDLFFFPVDPRIMDKDLGATILQSETGTLGPVDIALRREFPDRRGFNAMPLSLVHQPRATNVVSGVGVAPRVDRRAMISPAPHSLSVEVLTPAPGAFIGVPILPGPGAPPGTGEPGIDDVYVSGNRTVFGEHSVDNTTLNALYSMLLGATSDGKGNYELAAYIAVMLTESGGNPGAVGICLPGLGHAIGLFQLLTGADPGCPGTGGMGHPYSSAELMSPVNNINIARNALLDSWQGAVAQSGDPPNASTLASAFCSNGWEVGCISAGQPVASKWLAIRDGIKNLQFPLPE